MLTKPNILRLVFFLAAFAGAVYYPVREVLAFERPKVKPVEMRFRVGAYDPYDPMRGHYLKLRVQQRVFLSREECRKAKSLHRDSRRKLFAVLEPGKGGLATVTAVCAAPPAGKAFVRTEYVWFNDRAEKPCCSVDLPFNRYFINEKLAADAEGLLRNITRDKKHSAVLVVNIYADGRYAVKDLLVDGKPLMTYLRPAAAK